MKRNASTTVIIGLVAASVTGCVTSVSRPEVPAAVAVPAGHKPVMTLKGTGLLTYECRAQTGAAALHQWVFVAPDAALVDMRGAKVGRYYGGPTWEHMDGSKVTGKQLATAPGPTGAIPLQLVEATPVSGSGVFSGVTFIQRVNTVGGVAPQVPCTVSNAGAQQSVAYSADYIFYKR